MFYVDVIIFPGSKFSAYKQTLVSKNTLWPQWHRRTIPMPFSATQLLGIVYLSW